MDWWTGQGMSLGDDVGAEEGGVGSVAKGGREGRCGGSPRRLAGSLLAQ